MDINDLYNYFINVNWDTNITVIDNKTQKVITYGRFDEMPNRITSLNVVGFSFGETEKFDDILQRELKVIDKVAQLIVYVR